MQETLIEKIIVFVFKILGVIGPVILTVVLFNPKLKAKCLPQRKLTDGIVIFLIILIVATLSMLVFNVVTSFIQK